MHPKDWQLTTLNECSDLLTGFAFSSDDYVEPSALSIRLLRGDNVVAGGLRWDDAKHFPKKGEQSLKRFELKLGDIIIALDRPIVGAGLKCTTVKEHDLPCILVQRVARLRAKEAIDQGYLAQTVQTHRFVAHLKNQKTESAVPHVSPNDIRNYQIALPQMWEQKKIARILESWDAAISRTEKLLANSRKHKQALTHQVLRGVRRLSQFNGNSSRTTTSHGSIPADWLYPRIGTVAQEISVKHNSGADYPVLSCTKHDGLVDSLSYFKKRVFSEDLSTYKVVPRGAFVYATNHIEEGSIGRQDIYDFGLVSPMYTVFRTNQEVDDGYLYRLLKTEHYRQIFSAATNSSVDRRGSLRWNEFKKLHIPLPTLVEQRAIAELLSHADREIDLVASKLKLLRAEKAALMQQLLTGRRRVRLDESAEEASAA